MSTEEEYQYKDYKKHDPFPDHPEASRYSGVFRGNFKLIPMTADQLASAVDLHTRLYKHGCNPEKFGMIVTRYEDRDGNQTLPDEVWFDADLFREMASGAPPGLELKACPFCGHQPMNGDVMYGDHGYCAACSQCGAEGSTAPTYGEAVLKWNNRPTKNEHRTRVRGAGDFTGHSGSGVAEIFKEKCMKLEIPDNTIQAHCAKLELILGIPREIVETVLRASVSFVLTHLPEDPK